MTKTYCLGGRHMSNTNNTTQYEKVNPRTKKLFKIIKGTCSICSRNKSQFFLNKWHVVVILFKMLNVLTGIDQLWVIVLGVIGIKIVQFWIYTIFVIIQSVNVRNKLLLVQINFNWKVLVLKIQWKKYLKAAKQRGTNF